MRIYQILAALLMVSALMVSSAFAGISDSERVQKFEETSSSLAGRLDAAKNLDTCEALQAEISRLRDEYVKYKELIDFKLEGTYDNRLKLLASKLDQARDRIKKEEESKATKKELVTTQTTLVETKQKNEALVGEVVSLKAQIDTLVGEVTAFNTKISQLSEEKANLEKEIQTLEMAVKKGQETNANLEKEIKALKLVAKKNQETINKLKANIQDRDDLIVKLMESLNKDFEKTKLPAGEKETLALKINSDRFQDTMLTTIKMNVDFIDSTTLEAADLKSLRQEQQKFAERWITLKPSIAKLYADEQSKLQALQEVDTRISSWQTKIDETIWKRLHQVLTSQNIPVSPFANATEFHDNIIKYIDEQMTSSSFREKYKAFQVVWEKQIRENWLPVIQANNTLTLQQRTDIDNRIALWADKSKSLFGPIMWGIGIVGIIALIVYATVGKRLMHKDRG